MLDMFFIHSVNKIIYLDINNGEKQGNKTLVLFTWTWYKHLYERERQHNCNGLVLSGWTTI